MSIDFKDVQGIVVRGYGKDLNCARHFACGIGYAGGARTFVAALLDSVTTGEEWKVTPGSCLNLGFTYAGLKALEVAPAVLADFPVAFREGPALRARTSVGEDGDVGLGDVEESDPARWIMGGPNNPEVHVLVTVYANGNTSLEEASAVLRDELQRHGLTEHSCHDARALSDETHGRVHFGYKDGFSQPQIAGVARKYVADDPQPAMPTGDLLLGCDYMNSFYGNHAGDLPRELVDNATYGAFRILSQDVAGFQRMLDRWSHTTGLDPELLAAKLMGRWRSGVPLSLSPDTDQRLPLDRMNAFDYVRKDGYPDIQDDPDGRRCPIGSHVRRLNPRSGLVMGLPNSRRIIRRNMPYGPEYKGDNEKTDRGMIGYFLCGDLEAQWEFLQRTYVHKDIATYGLRDTREPIGATQPAGGGIFRLDDADDTVLDGLSTLVHTCGSLYCLLPGIGGLRYLAGART
jgi:deferrochelatase/peroxidase EfeB